MLVVVHLQVLNCSLALDYISDFTRDRNGRHSTRVFASVPRQPRPETATICTARKATYRSLFSYDYTVEIG